MKTPGNFDSIQALRGVAALLVVLFHLHLVEAKYGKGEALLPDLLQYANAGVDLFFVLSGFVMASIAAGRYLSLPAAGSFLARRAWRVLPPYWAYTTVVLVLMAIAPGLVNSSYPGQSVVASYLLWPHHQLPLLAVGWTLIHEAYFYLVMAIAIAFVRERHVPVFLLSWAAAAMAAYAALGAGAPPWAALVTNPLTLEFIAGAFIGLYWRRLHAAIALPVLVSGSVALAVSMFVLEEQPGPLARIIVFGVPCAMMVLGAVRQEHIGGFRLPRWLLAVGDSSYSLYLSHVFVLPAVGRLWLASGLNATPLEHAAFVSAALFCCTAFGLASYRWFERPLLSLGKRQSTDAVAPRSSQYHV